MDFKTLKKANEKRLASGVFSHAQPFGLADWCLAMAGEVGEACNAAKKIIRGDGNYDALRSEIADVVIYADLLASYINSSLEDLVRAKFNEKSDQVGSDVKL